MTLGASGSGIIDVIQKEVLIVLRLAMPAWECFLMSKEITDVEGTLGSGLRIILRIYIFRKSQDL